MIHKFEEFTSTLKQRLYTLHVSGYSHIVNMHERERERERERFVLRSTGNISKWDVQDSNLSFHIVTIKLLKINKFVMDKIIYFIINERYLNSQGQNMILVPKLWVQF